MLGRSRKGAWIENDGKIIYPSRRKVAPVRERGLKTAGQSLPTLNDDSRSRKGAWIEKLKLWKGRTLRLVAPVRERGLKSL